MDHLTRFLFVLTCLELGHQVQCSQGPVFVNSVIPIAATPSSNQGNYITQTVYGFLDFTTTIGNTIMVFSPQSAAAPAPVIEVKTDDKPAAINAVIETKPVVQEKSKEAPINPTKTQPEKKPTQHSKEVSTVVNVQSDQPKQASSKVNVVGGVSSVVNVMNSPIMSSKVEVIASPASQNKKPSVITKVEVVSSQPPVLSSKVEVHTSPSTTVTPVLSSVVQVQKNDEPAVIVGNNIGEPEYDFLSRQPSEVVEETYKVINLKPSSKFHLKHRPSSEPKNKANAATKRQDIHPTGLVTKLGGTVVKDGITTVHETSVIGTYISGKYAQVLQSTSKIQGQKSKINPSPSLRILKTAAPTLGKSNKHHRSNNIEPTPAGSISAETALPVENLFNSQGTTKTTRKPTGPGGSFKPQFKSRARKQENEEENSVSETPSPQQHKKKSTTRSRTTPAPRSTKHHTSQSSNNNKYGRSTSKTTTVSSVHSEEPTPPPSTGKRYQSRRNKQSRSSTSTPTPENNNGYTRRGFKPKVQPTAAEQPSASSSLYKFKLNRSPGRWQYKTTPKPRVTIRKQNDEDEAPTSQGTTPTAPQDSGAANDVVTPQSRSDDVDGLVGSESVASIIDDESSTENKLDTPFPLETLKVEISTPPDFKDIYYEIATIKSPYTFQVGSVKNTRYITVTSTIEKSFVNTESIAPTASEPLTENILTTSNYAKDNNFLDSSLATLPPLHLASDMETPPLETLTETFSTTQTMLKTHILPVVRGGNDTSTTTLVQTYLVTRLVTATKTLPPMDAYHFIPSKTLNEFNSHLDEAGSELHLELEFGDNNEQDEEGQQRKLFPPDLDLANIGSDFDLSDVDKSRLPEGHLRLKKAHTTPKPQPQLLPEPVPTPGLSPEQLQQLALLRLLNPAAAAQQGQVITTSKPVVKVETVYESHVIPLVNGPNTIFTTLSKIVGTVTKTDYEFGTSTIAPALPPIPPVNPLFPAQQPQFAVTSSPVVQNTVVTETQSKVLKLTFGAKTAYTTIFSTRVVPTVLTTYMTQSVPVQPTAAFPGYFPAPYPPFPYVG